MDIHIDEKNIHKTAPIPMGYVLDLYIDQPLLGLLNDTAALGIFGESAAESALYLIRTGLERLVTEGILELGGEDVEP